jgi:HK97 family phage prohead protease
VSLWDNLLSSIAVEKEYGLEDPQEVTNALLAYMQGETTPFDSNAFKEMQTIADTMKQSMQQRMITTPTYRKFAPPGSAWKEHSAPLPLELKADVNQRKGEITAYLSVWLDPNTGKPFIDSYKDIVHNTAFLQTVKDLEQARKYKNTDYLVPDLWQHDRHEQIGGIKAITHDSKGAIYVAQLVKSIARARYALDLAEQKMIGSSFGYDPVLFDYTGDIRNLKAVKLWEVSQVSFPANPYADVLGVKQSTFYVPSSYSVKPNPFAALETWAATTRSSL